MGLFSKKSNPAPKEKTKLSASSQGSGSRPCTNQTSSTQATSLSIINLASAERKSQVTPKPGGFADIPKAAKHPPVDSDRGVASVLSIDSHSSASDPTKGPAPAQQQSILSQGRHKERKVTTVQLRKDLSQEHDDLAVDLFDCPLIPGSERTHVIHEVYQAVAYTKASDKQISDSIKTWKRSKVADSQIRNIRAGLQKLHTLNDQSSLDKYLFDRCFASQSLSRKQRRSRLERGGCKPIIPMDYLAMIFAYCWHWLNKIKFEEKLKRRLGDPKAKPFPCRWEVPWGLTAAISIFSSDQDDQTQIYRLGRLTDSLSVPMVYRVGVFTHVYLADLHAPDVTSSQLSSFFKNLYAVEIDTGSIDKIRRKIGYIRGSGPGKKNWSDHPQASSSGLASLMQTSMADKDASWRKHEDDANETYSKFGEVGRRLSILEWRGAAGLMDLYVPK